MPFLLPWYELQQKFRQRLAMDLNWAKEDLSVEVESFLTWRAETASDVVSNTDQLAALASAYFCHVIGQAVPLEDIVARLQRTKVGRAAIVFDIGGSVALLGRENMCWR